MKIIETQFTSNGFTHKQIVREGDLAIYEKNKTDGQYKGGYEVVRIKRHNGYTIAGVFCPPSEMYPSNSVWGVDGFTATSKQEAFSRMDKMKVNLKTNEASTGGEKRGRGRPKGVKNRTR